MILAIVQGALSAHAGAVAQAAADHGVEVAAALGSSDAEGEAAALQFVANAGLLREVVVSAHGDPADEFVQMQITGAYPTVFGMRPVSATAATIRERIPES